MNSLHKYREIILNGIYGIVQNSSSRQALITAVDEENDTCTITMESVEYENVPIKSVSMSSNVVGYPAIGSYCNVYFLEGNTQVLRLLDFQDCQKIKITNIPASGSNEAVKVIAEIDISEFSLTLDKLTSNIKESNYTGENETKSLSGDYKLDANNILFNGGNNGGLVLASVIVRELNALKKQFNSLTNGLNAGVIKVPSMTGGVFPLITYTGGAVPVPETIVSDVENPKIKQ